jgi:hypothetical protein
MGMFSPLLPFIFRPPLLCLLLCCFLAFTSSIDFQTVSLSMIGNLGLSFACQNCNSLNMSHSSIHNQRQKIDAIAGLKTDIIFLSDLRLGNKNLTSTKGDIINLFRVNNCKSYSLISNSTRNKRGVMCALRAA